MREAPSRIIIETLTEIGAIIKAYDPVAIIKAYDPVTMEEYENLSR